MDLDLRLAALSKLVNNKSEAVERRLGEEYRSVGTVLTRGSDYDELVGALKTLSVLAPRFHGAVLPLLVDFAHSILSRTLTSEGEPIPPSRLRYRSSSHLVRDAIDVADTVRYLHTEAVVDFLLDLTQTEDEEVRAKAARAIEALAQFDLQVFYGPQGLGAEPQTRLVTHLAHQDDAKLVANADSIFDALHKVLSPSMQSHSWTYSSVTINRGSVTNSGGVAEMRRDAISLLERMYPLKESIEYRKGVLNTLNTATRREQSTIDAATASMFERDALMVLGFLVYLVALEALPLVQMIERQAYWNYFHAATPAIESAALAVRDVLETRADYKIYKQLIGFEGIFGQWEELRRSESAWDYSDTKRHAAARQYLEEIDDASYEEWRDRILEFSKTKSEDLATFPVFYEFLASIGRERPNLAMDLVTDHSEVMSPFLIPLLRGLWSSQKSAEVEEIVVDWIAEGKYLGAIAKSLYESDASRLHLLYSVVARSLALDHLYPVHEVIVSAVNLYARLGEPAKAVFMHAVHELARRNDGRWTANVWFSREFRALVDGMTSDERAEALASLTTLPNLDYHAEEVLSFFAEYDVQAVIDFVSTRLRLERERSKQDLGPVSDEDSADKVRFEAVPFELQKLDKQFAKAPEAVVAALRSDFNEETRGLFTYHGARLAKSVFPDFGEPLESLLQRYITDGSEDDAAFVLGILRNYEGSPAVLETCRKVIKAIPEGAELLGEAAACIQSTGVVSGEYGLVDAFEKRLSEMVAWQNDDDPKVRSFAQKLTESLDGLIESEKQRVEESIALRKYRFGVGEGEE